MDETIIGANFLVAVDYFPATIMLMSAMVICMNVLLRDIISLPKGQYISLLFGWAFLILEIFHAIAVILSLDVLFSSLLNLLQDMIRGNCLPGEGLICHLLLETASHLVTLIAAGILVSVLTLEEEVASRIVPEAKQALLDLEVWCYSENPPVIDLGSITSAQNKIPLAQNASRTTPIPKAHTASKNQPGPSDSKLKPKISPSIEPKVSPPKATPIKKPSLVTSIPIKNQPQSSNTPMKPISNTSMVPKYHKGTIRKSSLMDAISKKEQEPPTSLKIKPATRNSGAPKPKAKVSVSTKPPTLIAPPPGYDQPGYSGGNVKPIPNSSMVLRKPAIKGVANPPQTNKKSAKDNEKLAQQKSAKAKKK